MLRRSFLKRIGALIGLAYVNPIALIPELPAIAPTVVTGNYLVTPAAIASEALSLLEHDLTFSYVKPAMKKLADKIDEDIVNQLLGGSKNGSTYRSRP